MLRRAWRYLLIMECCLVAQAAESGRVTIRYWDKWTGFEADAMRAVVADFNASQDRIFVEFNSVSMIERRLTLAIAGGVPPDVAGVWDLNLPIYVESNALMPLDRMAREAGITGGDYLPVIWKLCHYRGRLWALPSTPSCTALIYNKKLFREAGLDPEKPPRSIRELEEYNKALTRWTPEGRLQSVGHLAEEPGWWSTLWTYWFGGRMTDSSGRPTATDPHMVEAYRWVASYPERFGARNLLALRDGFGNFASPQNPFFTGRVAMIMQGVWINNFIENYAPAGFEWGVAPFPSNDPENLKDVTVVESDVLVIPAGARHPAEAFEFIAYVNSRAAMEKLCLGQKKFSPLAVCSEEFFQRHPNPFIREFLRLAKSPNARTVPMVINWNEYASSMKNAVSLIWTGKLSPEEALADVQARQEKIFARRSERWSRSGPAMEQAWEKP